MILSALAFSIMSLLVKVVSEYGISILEVVAVRSIISLVISGFTLKHKGIAPFGNRKLLLFSRGLVGFIALNCVFYALTSLPLAEATILQYLHPMFTAVLAIFFLGERSTGGSLICIALSFIGVIIMVQPDVFFTPSLVKLDSFAVLVGISGAFLSAIAYIIVRALNKTEDPAVIILYFPMISLPISIILLWQDFVMPSGEVWFYLVAIGITTHVGQIAITKAMQTETASRATSFGYLQVVFATLLGAVFYHEVPHSGTLIGAGLIIAGAYINVTWKRKALQLKD
ncbi:MAG: hypothetical protein A6F70_08115 [Cycloclasticus sp. symbiont of Bathymodiolus heckerae]|nr:MAG: hypothetical protein A6F70_08115 [Cycloclasticus sp. symbiont of Bathymodiolus heckerae]